jgi:hypothetical protein
MDLGTHRATGSALQQFFKGSGFTITQSLKVF